MTNFTKKVGCGVLAACMAVNLLAASGCKKLQEVDNTVEDTTDLWIYVQSLGYDSEFLYALEEEFEKRNEGVDVHVTDTPLAQVISNQLSLGPQYDDYDLYFQMASGRAVQNTYKNKWKDYPEGLQDLTYIFEKTIPGEDVTLGEKMIDSYYKYTNCGTEEEPKHYSISFAMGTIGMNYNIDVMKEIFGDGYEEYLPLTSDHFLEVCETIKNKPGDYTPLTYPALIDHMQYALFHLWWAQYEGIENYERFFKAEAYDEVSGVYLSPSKKIYNQQGRLESLKAMASLMDADKGYVDEMALDYNETNFRSLQTRFLEKSLGYVFYPCGDWLEQESAVEGSSEFGRMKSPVISSIIDRLPTVDNDTELREIIRYVDGTAETINPKYSEEDIEEVRKARNMVYGAHGFDHAIIMPQYSNAKALAEKFLLFMASDDGIRIFKENCAGGFLPFEFDYSEMENLSTFEKTVAEQIKDATVVGNLLISQLALTGIPYVMQPTIGTLDTLFTSKKSSKFYRTAEEVYELMTPSDAEWQSALMAAGMA